MWSDDDKIRQELYVCIYFFLTHLSSISFVVTILLCYENKRVWLIRMHWGSSTSHHPQPISPVIIAINGKFKKNTLPPNKAGKSRKPLHTAYIHVSIRHNLSPPNLHSKKYFISSLSKAYSLFDPIKQSFKISVYCDDTVQTIINSWPASIKLQQAFSRNIDWWSQSVSRITQSQINPIET